MFLPALVDCMPVLTKLCTDHIWAHPPKLHFHFRSHPRLHLHIRTRQPWQESPLRHCADPCAVPSMGNAHSDSDNGWLASGIVRRHWTACCSHVRLLDAFVSNIPRWTELHSNTCLREESLWRRQELIQPQSVWIKL